MLVEALNWWAERMMELVPRRTSGFADAIIVAAGGSPNEPASILSRRNGTEALLGRFVPGVTDQTAVRGMLGGKTTNRPVLLRPPRGALLEKQLPLPLAAARGLRRVVGYEMNRITPFEPDDVLWTCAVVRQDRAAGRLMVRLSLVPRAGLAKLLEALQQVGLSPTALEATPAHGPPRLILLQQDADRLARRRRVTVAMAGACGTLAVVAAALPFGLQALALNEVADRIAAVQPQVTEAQALRTRLATASASQDAIENESRRLGNTLEVLATVTQLLPDDTVLNDLSLRQRRLTITGQSGAAPKLISVLAADTMFRNPGFAAPVTRNVAAGRDVFSISAGVGP